MKDSQQCMHVLDKKWNCLHAVHMKHTPTFDRDLSIALSYTVSCILLSFFIKATLLDGSSHAVCLYCKQTVVSFKVASQGMFVSF